MHQLGPVFEAAGTLPTGRSGASGPRRQLELLNASRAPESSLPEQ